MENEKEIKTPEVQVAEFLEKIDNKEFGFYFFTLDTLGNPVASVANIYEHVKVLNELGYKAYVLHEKNDYKLRSTPDDPEDNGRMGIAEWLGEEYANLPHVSIEAQQLNVSPTDYIIIPEIFANVMDQVKAFPCKKIVFSQSYDYLLELLPIGKRWNIDYGFSDVITTSEKQSNYINNLFPGVIKHVIPVGIADYFKPSDKPKVPIVSILTRNQGDAQKIAKAFYLQYPIYKFVTFKELRGIPKEQFAKELGKSCLAVWIDDQGGFGTFPLEAMECDTPVIGKIPNMIPEWMENVNVSEDGIAGEITLKNNGVWTNTTLNIPELIGTFMKVWFEDTVPQDILDSMEETKGSYTMERQRKVIEEVYGNIVATRREEVAGMIKPKEEETNVELKK